MTEAFHFRMPAWQAEPPHDGAPPAFEPPPIIGESLLMRTMLREIDKIARSHAPVLIYGETGSGKELAARAIHDRSGRRIGPFVAVNCGAVPDGLIETELFGHGQGAFTDARQARRGLIAQAQGGTLFLDEIDTLSPKAQVTLLRFLQDLRYRPVGTTKEIASDLGIVTASNQRLQPLVDDGRFRRDLFYRLNIFELTIPPLRDRDADIELLAHHFIRHYSGRYAMPPKRLDPDTLEWLRHYDWPGNVRELENWIHRELLLADGDEIGVRDQGAHRDRPADAAPDVGAEDFRTARARALAEFERTYVARVLAEAGGSVTRAARIAGKERRSFGKLLKKYCIDRTRFTLDSWVLLLIHASTLVPEPIALI
jgi:DNA-binding NtrC family response regulator